MMLEHGGFADALRQWRARRRVSQLELAQRAATTQRHLSFIERGRSVPGRAMVVRLAEALEVPLRERNALLLHPDGLAPQVVNVDQWAWHVIDALRHETARNPTDRLEALVTEFEGLVPDRPGTRGRSTWASRSRCGFPPVMATCSC